MTRCSLAILIVLLLWSVLSGQGPKPEFYVAPYGSNSADGTSVGTPLRSIQEGLSRARAQSSATIWVLPGNYNAVSETFPLEVPANTTVAGVDPGNKPRIGGTFDWPVFFIHDIPASLPP